MRHLFPVVLVLAAALVSAAGALAYGLGSPSSTLLGPAVVRMPDAGEVALTFDDGPSEPFTAQVLDVLREERVKATFFVCGATAERYPELVRRIRDEGHAIGNHTFSHPSLHLMSRESIASEIDRTQDALERITGRRPTLFRPPFGVRWFPLWELLRERRMTMVLWSAFGRDGRRDADGVVRETLSQVGPGAIILLHDGDEAKANAHVRRSATVAALPEIIRSVRASGYRLVPLQS